MPDNKTIQECINVTQRYKEIEKVYNKNEDLASLQFVEENSLSLLKKIKKLLKGKVRGETARTLQEYKGRTENLLYDTRFKYLETINKEYKTDIKIKEYLKSHRELLSSNLLVSIISEEGLINNIFQNIIKDLIPRHPKDEYPETRSIHRHFIIHCGGTNTGKTYNAIQALKAANTGVYLAPLRLLALEIFQTLNKDGVPCTLSTGEEDIVVPNAKHISSTIEKLNVEKTYDVAVIDEAQMMSDTQRGNAWTRAILAVKAREVHVCCSKNANKLLIQLINDCGDTYEVYEYERNTPLIIEEEQFKFLDSVQPGDALVVFSKKMVLRIAGILTSKGKKVSVLYGNLPPETRRKQMQLFIDKVTDIVVTTDVIGMGLNLPIKRVVFLETQKYDGQDYVTDWDYNSSDGHYVNKRRNGKRVLNDSEIKQIAGRAGRKNIFDEGLVNSYRDKSIIKKALKSELSDLKWAYSTPADKYILAFPIGTLKERLVAWLHSDDNIRYIKKANIDEPLTLLDILDDEKFKLSIEEKYKLVFIPFDSKNQTLVSLWIEYIKSYIANKKIELPEAPISDTLDSLELYYRELDLYYSFCKEMNLDCDGDLVMNIKAETSQKIHDILRGQMKKLKHTCRICGKELDWDFPYNICNHCYNKKYNKF